jgi:hypothetical protein
MPARADRSAYHRPVQCIGLVLGTKPWHLFAESLAVGGSSFMKLFAARPPGDIVAAYRTHMNGGTVLSETSLTIRPVAGILPDAEC